MPSEVKSLFLNHYRSLLLVLCTLYVPGLALDPAKAPTQYVQDIWQAKKGLPRTVLSIAQTSDGYLWLGTSTGLVRFDGINFTSFDETVDTQAPSKGIWELLVARDGTLWICSWSSGLHTYKHGHFRRFTEKDGLPPEEIRTVYEDYEGTIWVGTLTSGMYRLREGKTKQFTTRDGLCANDIKSIIEGKNGELWISSYGGGVCRFRDGSFKTFALDHGLPSLKVRESYKDKTGAIWFATLEGLVKIKDEKITVYKVKDGLSSDRIFPMVEDRHGNLWIGTEGGGLNRFREGRFISFTTKNGFSDDDVKCIYEDKEGSLWIGTTNGLTRLKDGNFLTITAKEGLVNDSVRAVHQDRSGAMWFGTVDGLTRYKDGKFSSYSKENGLSVSAILSLADTEDGSLWIGTHAGGLINYSSGRFSSRLIEGRKNDVVSALHVGRDGTLWIGNDQGSVFSLKNERITKHLSDERIRSVRAIYEDTAGAVWSGARGGAKRLLNGNVTHYNVGESLPNNQVNVFYQDKKGVLWCGTSNGLAAFINDRFILLTKKHGLHDIEICQIFEDEAGNLWFGSFNGVFKVKQKELIDCVLGKTKTVTSIPYGIQDGLRNLNCSHPAHSGFGVKDKDGRLWFPTLGGVSVVETAKITSNKTPPPVIIESFIDSETKTKLSASSLPVDHSSLEIRYTGVSLLHPEEVKFKYKLEGFDNNWIDAGTRRTAYYTNLPPGNYKFKVIACNNDGVWNEAGASISFSLTPPFYETGWFKLLFVLLVLLVGIRQYRRKEEALTANS
jgi:ligand-binding sensor domain-containing protein